MTSNKAGDINPILSDEGLRSLKGVLERALGKRFHKEFDNRFPKDWAYRTGEVDEATHEAIWSFTYAVEELLEETFEMIVDDICLENQWGLSQEQKDELEEGKSL